jgi:cutinase
LEARLRSTSGNVGLLTGPPFFATMAEYMSGTNQLSIQGVNYSADIAGFPAGGSPIGVVVMCVTFTLIFISNSLTSFRVKLINHTLAACLSTLLLLSGYL